MSGTVPSRRAQTQRYLPALRPYSIMFCSHISFNSAACAYVVFALFHCSDLSVHKDALLAVFIKQPVRHVCVLHYSTNSVITALQP